MIFYKESKSKINCFFFRGGGTEGVGEEGDRWMDRQRGPNKFAPSTSLKLGV